ncbi:MAG: LruC domain-containing protein [Prevotella sp.]|nr:LruC domain-containing protein [Prevotella sp.]
MKKLFWIAMALLSLGVTACKDDIVFDQETYDNLIKKAFVIENVDPTHKWATMGVANTNITVNTGTSDTYQVKIYDQNPIGYEGTLKLMGEGRIADGGRLNMKVTYPLAQAYAYVTLFDSQNYMSVYPAVIKDGELDVDISTNTAQARKRALQPSFQFPEDADQSKFLADVPAGVKPFAEVQQWGGYASGVSYLDESWTGAVNIWGAWDGSKNSGGTLYIKGTNYFLDRSFSVAQNTDIYLVENAVLVLGSGSAGNLQSGCNIYLAPGAKIATPYSVELVLNNGLHIYNHGTLDVYKLSTNSNSWLVNGGTVTVTSKISVENEQSVIVNNGTITATDLNTAGSGKFENNNMTTISGTTFVNSNYNAWVNNGEYHTGNFIYNAGSDDVINNCKMIVDEDFNINLYDNSGNASFKMDAGSSVVTKYFNGGGNWSKNYSTGWNAANGGPFYIFMGAGSMFDVTETATMNATKANYGIYGPSSGNFAVFRAKRVVAGSANQGYEVTYGGNLYVATNDHFSNGWSGQYPYIDVKGGAALTAYDGAKIKLTNAGCGAAYNGNPDSGDHPSAPVSLRYCFEDNFPDAGDYDFNDVVLTVTPSLDDKTLTLKVSLDAVGALKTVGAGIRLVNIKSTDLTEYRVDNGFSSPEGRGLGDYNNIGTGDTFLTENHGTNASGSMVIVLFKDAHWAINPEKASDGGVQRSYYNTIIRNTGEHNNQYVDPVVATYTLVFKDAEKAKEMLAESLYDVFIVEPYNGGFWEVHTVQNGFKTAQVLNPTKPAGYAEAYGSNMPWAVLVPGDFKYPNEWQVIGRSYGGELTGAYQTPGHSFAEWAENSETATDWYLYPTEELVFK